MADVWVIKRSEKVNLPSLAKRNKTTKRKKAKLQQRKNLKLDLLKALLTMNARGVIKK
jgi:hypothetical protein